jgi:threonine dehydratase
MIFHYSLNYFSGASELETRSVTEPAGALALAGLKKYILDNQLIGSRKKFVVVISGANMNFDRLRFVAERAELGEGREALLSVDIPERSGRCAHAFSSCHRALFEP